MVIHKPDLFIRGSFGEPEMFPDEDRVEGWYETISELTSGSVSDKKVGPLLVVASTFSGPNDLKKKITKNNPCPQSSVRFG